MGKILVSEEYAKAYEKLEMLAFNDGLSPPQRAIGLLVNCYLNGRDYAVSVLDAQRNTYKTVELKDYMPQPYDEHEKTFAVPWLSDDEKDFYKDLLYGVTMDMEALNRDDPLLAVILLQYEMVRSGGRLAFAKPE